jgi:hypothetical protein
VLDYIAFTEDSRHTRGLAGPRLVVGPVRRTFLKSAAHAGMVTLHVRGGEPSLPGELSAIHKSFLLPPVLKEMLYDPSRHETLAAAKWNSPRVRDSIAAICRDAESAFHPGRFWPLHPEDDDTNNPADGIFRGLYGGAAGMLHAFDRLRRAGPPFPEAQEAGRPRGCSGAMVPPASSLHSRKWHRTMKPTEN